MKNLKIEPNITRFRLRKFLSLFVVHLQSYKKVCAVEKQLVLSGKLHNLGVEAKKQLFGCGLRVLATSTHAPSTQILG